MKTVAINNEVYFLPENWNELSSRQLTFLAKISDQDMPAQEIRLKMVIYCLNARIIGYTESEFKIRIRKHIFYVSAEQFAPICDIFDFIFGYDKNGNMYIDSRLFRNPFPTIKIFGHTLIGPDDALTNITYDQFVFLQTLYERSASDHTAIDLFIAVIYKLKNNKNADKWIARIPLDVKKVLVWFYCGSLRFIADKYPRVFSPEDGESASNDTVFDSQQKIIHSLANGELTKKELVRNSLLYDALYTMELNIQQQDDLKSKYDI